VEALLPEKTIIERYENLAGTPVHLGGAGAVTVGNRSETGARLGVRGACGVRHCQAR